MLQSLGSPEAQHVVQGDYPEQETPLETGWTFWYDKKTSDRKESDQYLEGLKQLGSFNTIEGFYRHYTYLLRPSELPRDHNLYLFRKGCKPMWEEFPEGGCWIVRVKRKASLKYVNHMWENLLMSCIGEDFEMPDVVGCVLSTRLKDDVLSVWNFSNRNTPARFRIGEKLKEVLNLDMHTLIQYKEHMQSLYDYSTFRNAKNYMFAPSPNVTPLQGTLGTPLQSRQENGEEQDLEMLPAAAIDEMLPPAAVDSEGVNFPDVPWPMARASGGGREITSNAARGGVGAVSRASPTLKASAAPWSPGMGALAAPALPARMKAPTETDTGSACPLVRKLPLSTPPLSPSAEPWYPPSSASVSGGAAELPLITTAAQAEAESCADPRAGEETESLPLEDGQPDEEEQKNGGGEEQEVARSYATVVAASRTTESPSYAAVVAKAKYAGSSKPGGSQLPRPAA